MRCVIEEPVVDIKQLRYFLALVREKHFARAAEASHISQPAFSAHIRRLEHELGVSIIQRGNRYEGLTSDGEIVLGWAKKIIAVSDQLFEEVAVLKNNLTGSLNLGIIPSALPVVNLLTAPLLELHPNLSINIYSKSSAEIERGLDDFSLHAGLTYLDNEPLKNVKKLGLYAEEYYLIAAAGDQNIGEGEITWKEASKLKLALLTPDMQNRRILDAVFLEFGVLPKPLIETNSVIALYTHVRNGGIYSIIPHVHFKTLGPDAGIKALRLCEPEERQEVGLVSLDTDPVSPKISALWENAKAANIREKLNN